MHLLRLQLRIQRPGGARGSLQETWNLCDRLCQPSFYDLFLQGLGGGGHGPLDPLWIRYWTNGKATKILGSQVQSLLEVTFLLNLFCSNAIVALMSEWSVLGKPRLSSCKFWTKSPKRGLSVAPPKRTYILQNFILKKSLTFSCTRPTAFLCLCPPLSIPIQVMDLTTWEFWICLCFCTIVR